MRPLALVTGGCRRLGAAIAADLGRAGWDLALHASREAEPEPELIHELAKAGAEWRASVADFRDPAAASRLVPEVAAAWGRAPRLLVNSASLFGQDRLADVSAAELVDHHLVNCAAPVLLTRAFAALDAHGGEDRSIVNILDQRISHPHGDQLAYTLSKIGLAGFTRIAARELAPAVRVNAVAPGLTLPTDDYGAAQLDALTRAMPLGRLPVPGDVAGAVRFLVEARAVTGQCLFVDAGAAMESWPGDFMHLAGEV